MKFAIIGAGYMGQRWIKTLVGAGHEIPIIVDPLSKQDTHGYGISQPWPDTLPVDGAIIASPNDWHHFHAAYMFGYRVPMLIEKPLAGTVKDAMHIEIDARKASGGTPVMVGHIERFNPAYAALKNLVHRPTMVRSIRSGPDRLKIPVEIDLGVHGYDLADDLLGWPLDAMQNVLSHPGGVSVHINVYSDIKIRNLSVVDGRTLWHVNFIEQTLTGNQQYYDVQKEDSLTREMNAFIKMIDTGDSPVTVMDGYQAVLAAEVLREFKDDPSQTGLIYLRR